MSIRITAMAILASAIPVAANGDVLRDLKQRVDYGYYGGDAAVLRAASQALAPLAERNPEAQYLHALAHFRLAATSRRDDEAIRSLGVCVAQASALADSNDEDAEARILLAACAFHLAEQEPLKAMLHTRRGTHALDEALALDPENPRGMLIRSDARAADAPRGAAYATALARAVAEFESRAADNGGPSWGEAEARVRLAGLHLAAGDVRQARDAIEAALLVAPGFTEAVNLRNRLVDTPVR